MLLMLVGASAVAGDAEHVKRQSCKSRQKLTYVFFLSCNIRSLLRMLVHSFLLQRARHVGFSDVIRCFCLFFSGLACWLLRVS